MEKSAIHRLLTRLRELREAHGLTQEAFAERAGLGYKHYQLIEIGRKPDLRLSTLERIATAYGLEVWQLLAPTFPRLKRANSGRPKAARKLPARRSAK